MRTSPLKASEIEALSFIYEAPRSVIVAERNLWSVLLTRAWARLRQRTR